MDQQQADILMSMSRRHEQWSPLIILTSVHSCTALNQQLYDILNPDVRFGSLQNVVVEATALILGLDSWANFEPLYQGAGVDDTV